MTIEERASQLLHELTTLGEEKETIATRLKTARRESQRADAALRSEIEALKRASEKSAQADQRNRQKILALQEATKQSLAASVEADEQVKLVEASLPQLEERAKAVEIEYQRIKEKASEQHSTSTEAMKADKKQINDLEAELVALNHRLERLTARKDKLAMETVPELERELGQLGRKIEEAERSGTQTPPMSDDAHGDQCPGLSRRLSQPTSQQPGNWTSYPFGWNPLGSPQEPLAQRCR
jgi:chromosome segregation ATPase